jgi:ATP-dependent Lhr-like helicase
MSALDLFHPAVGRWFRNVFAGPTRAQELGWPLIQSGSHTLILAPTGSGKTLAAFLSAIDHLMFSPVPPKRERCRVLYISPLKALAVDVERNLRAPIAGISVAAKADELLMVPSVAIRTGDTPSTERGQFARNPSDILITTPESLYLLVTSNAREVLRSVRWVIVDEIHAMVSNKRGAHLALSLERLEAITRLKFQRIGLSATQRPLDEVARFLGGGEVRDGEWKPRPVSIVDAGGSKKLDLKVVVPVEDMSRLGEVLDEIPSGPVSQGPARRSLWPSLYPQILDLIRKHRTTLLFVNNRRLAERVASTLNELAGEELVRAHHGSVAREQRLQIEEELKSGNLPAIVATSSLELGIDMGSIDLVLQIECPPSVASGLQRIGRAGHQAGASSKGVIFPKYRGDLIACAALIEQMEKGAVEAMHYLRNPLDVLAQQIVAMVSMDPWNIDDLFRVIRGAANFSTLTQNLLENVLDMLSGRYPSDEFGELRPRIVWDRISGTLKAREGAKRIAIANGGTIPDRGLFRVVLAGADPGKGRVGELDEEMVFETRAGETFLLGATSWRVEDITQDRVIVSPAPGQPGKMPFWHGDAAGRPLDFGRAIGNLMRTLRAMPETDARSLLMDKHKLDDWAAQNLLAYLKEQTEKTGDVPDDHTIVIERYMDDLGDWRVCLLSPFGAKIHAPLTHAMEALVQKKLDLHVETLWSDDGIVIRFPETDEPPDIHSLIPDPEEVESLVVSQMGASALFAARFREAAARALLLPRRFPGQRAPLWQQRKRAYDLLQVTAKYQNFPIILETYREVLQDVFDMPALKQVLKEIQSRSIRLVTVTTRTPSPFASSLLFGYVGNFIYEGDAPLAERRAQALSVDQSQLRELLGESELRELLDPEIIHNLELQLQRLDFSHRVKTMDGVHDLLLQIGDLSSQEVFARCAATTNAVEGWLRELSLQRRVVSLSVAGEQRWIAAEDAARYRDGVGVPSPPGLPEAFLQPVGDPQADLIARYARTHGPFHEEEVSGRLGMDTRTVQLVLNRLEEGGRIVRGEFRRGRSGWEWCDAGVLRSIRQKSLAKLRKEIEPVEASAYARFLLEWQQVGSNRKGAQALLEVIEQLEGYAIPASVLESQILPARLANYDSRDLDMLMASGLVFWCGLEPLAQADGKVALYLTDHAGNLVRTSASQGNKGDLYKQIIDFLSTSGASFFPQIVSATGERYKKVVLDALWDLVWEGIVTNDTLLPLRAFLSAKKKRKSVSGASSPIPLEAAGRWFLVNKIGSSASPTDKLLATARLFLNRQGIVTREGIMAEKIPGGFSSIYPIFKTLEESGKIRRGYFIAGRGAAQFADPGALERLRSVREEPEERTIRMLAATDPANPYGAALPWPERSDHRLPGRSAGAQVILINGFLAAYLMRGEKSLLTFFNREDPAYLSYAEGVAKALADEVKTGKRRAIYLTEIDGEAPEKSLLAPALLREGFVAYPQGWQFKVRGEIKPASRSDA